jgi:hypothetical protein
MLRSVNEQSFQATRVLISDDSTDRDSERLEGTRATVELVTTLVPLTGIVVLVDADDELLPGCLEAIAEAYAGDPRLDACWTNHVMIHPAREMPGVSGELLPGADPYSHPWVSSHCKSFRAELLHRVARSNYLGEDGLPFRRIADQAIMLPVLWLARRWKFIPAELYRYQTRDHDAADVELQAREAAYLRSRGFLGCKLAIYQG